MTSPQYSYHYPNLFDWNLIESCNEKHLVNCAKYINRFICEFNDLAKANHRLDLERKKSEKMYTDLISTMEKSDHCQNCVLLEHRFQEQKSKLKTITDLLAQIDLNTTSKNESIFTQVDNDEDHTPVNVDSDGKRESRENVDKFDFCNEKTPQKRAVKKARRKSTDENDGALDQMSPILKKGRNSKKPLHDNNRPTPMKNLSNKFKSENESDLIQDDESIFDESSSYNEDVAADQVVLELYNSTKEFSVGLLQSSSKLKKNAKMKQGRLSFTKTKPKLSLNVSQTKKFSGGLRKAIDSVIEHDVIKKEKEEVDDEIHDIGLNDDLDEIIESPSCLKLNSLKKYNLSKVKIDDENVLANKSEDEDATMFIPSVINTEEKQVGIEVASNVKKASKDLPIEEKPLRDFVYIEDPIRKKIDKKKVPGWSCTKCAEFYEVAFKGNDNMIKKKINECSKHRGRFNPERQNTPPGFWEMKMPPIDDTEASNIENNKK